MKRNYYTFDRYTEHNFLGPCDKLCYFILYISFYILILQSEFWGKTGLIRFDEKGERSDIELEIHQVLSQSEWGSIQMVGTWTTREGLMWRGPNLDAENG